MNSSGTVSTVSLNKCIYFSVDKERYTPYTTFKGSFITSQYFEEVISINFLIDGTAVHYGSIDMARITYSSGNYRLDISSRSYTLALGLNQPKPQINSSVTLSNLLSRNVSLKNVTYETGTKTVNYIYVLDNSTLWDAVVAYSLKAYNKYPYIYKTNEIRINEPSSIRTKNYSKTNVVEIYSGSTLSNLLSHIHMKDTEDNYETYNLTDSYATSRDIVRHKQIPLDYQWLADTNMALQSRIDFAKRGTKYKGIKALGYMGEELFDKFNYIDFNQSNKTATIHKLNITGRNNIIYTTMYEYTDAY